MATQPPSDQPTDQMPLLYGGLVPLSSNQHANFKARSPETAPFLAKVHAIPLTVDEFSAAQRYYPIIFSSGDMPVPLALMGLNEGVNTFVDDDGKLRETIYLPAYVRRYPWMLARLTPEAEELSLCFDPTSEIVGEFDEGLALFEDGKPTETVNTILKFCEEFELAAQRTQQFLADLKELDLLMDGEVSIQPKDSPQPVIYRGFQMVAEEKFRALDAETLHKMHTNGALPLIMAHLFSLPLIRDVFGRQMQQGKLVTDSMEPVGTA